MILFCKIIEERGASITEAAALIKKSENTIRSYMSGESKPRIDDGHKLAEWLGVPPEEANKLFEEFTPEPVTAE